MNKKIRRERDRREEETGEKLSGIVKRVRRMMGRKELKVFAVKIQLCCKIYLFRDKAKKKLARMQPVC